VGQLLARQGKNADQINDRIGLNLDVARPAVAEKDAMTPMQALIAQGWFDAEFSDAGLERRRRNSAELKSAFEAREAACDVFKRSPTKESREKLKKAKARFGRAQSLRAAICRLPFAVCCSDTSDLAIIVRQPRLPGSLGASIEGSTSAPTASFIRRACSPVPCIRSTARRANTGIIEWGSGAVRGASPGRHRMRPVP
jgi:hypothetical protein